MIIRKIWKVKSVLEDFVEMCDICMKNPCDPRCPNAPEPPSVFICSGCGDSIFDGDKYVELMGEQWCMDCIEECTREAEYDPY